MSLAPSSSFIGIDMGVATLELSDSSGCARNGDEEAFRYEKEDSSLGVTSRGLLLGLASRGSSAVLCSSSSNSGAEMVIELSIQSIN